MTEATVEKDAITCPMCSAQDLAQPVLFPLEAVFVCGGKSAAPRHPVEKAFLDPHTSRQCRRCGYREIKP